MLTFAIMFHFGGRVLLGTLSDGRSIVLQREPELRAAAKMFVGTAGAMRAITINDYATLRDGGTVMVYTDAGVMCFPCDRSLCATFTSASGDTSHTLSFPLRQAVLDSLGVRPAPVAGPDTYLRQAADGRFILVQPDEEYLHGLTVHVGAVGDMHRAAVSSVHATRYGMEVIVTDARELTRCVHDSGEGCVRDSGEERFVNYQGTTYPLTNAFSSKEAAFIDTLFAAQH